MIRQLFNKNRRGVSILEVLFAIMISAIGLMGAIAVFPAALLQTKRGQQADMTAAAGVTATHTFDAMGMRRPDRWLYWETTRPGAPWGPGGAGYWPITQAYNAGPYTAMNPPQHRYPSNGSLAYCIDPRFIAANSGVPAANGFPYGSSFSRMARVTLDNGANPTNNPVQMAGVQADFVFRIEDDLAYDRFTGNLNGIDQSTQQAASLFARGPSPSPGVPGPPLKRESHGHMSWMATVSPKIERLQVPGGTTEDRYVLSVVVFYDRPTQLEATSGYEASEWELNVTAMYGSGIGGGDMQLSVDNSLAAEEQLRRLTIHRDQWIMLMGNPTPRNGERQMTICRWYRVIDSDDPNANLVDVTLAGADWEVPMGETRAVAVKGVVAVFEKTIKLEPRN